MQAQTHIIQPAAPRAVSDPANLDFKAGISGWGLGDSDPDRYEIDVDHTVVHGGSSSGTIRSIQSNVNRWGVMEQTFVPSLYRGQRVRMSAYVKTKDVWGVKSDASSVHIIEHNGRKFKIKSLNNISHLKK